MGIVNRIVNILVLVTAIVAVIFAYLLFSKREKLVDGWDQMARAITATATSIDANGASGTKAVTELGNLDHKEYDRLAGALPKLKENAEKVVKQRNDLSEAVSEVAATLEIQGIDSKDLKSVETSAGKQSEVKEKVAAFKTRTDNVAKGFSTAAGKLGLSVSVDDLKEDAKIKDAADKFVKEAGNLKNRSDSYKKYIATVSRILGTTNPNLEGDDYASTLNGAASSIENYRDSFEKTKRDLETEKGNVKLLKKQVADRDSEITKNLASIQGKDDEIAKLKKVIYGEGGEEQGDVSKPMPTNADLLKLIKGKVAFVNTDYGYVAIDIGSKHAVVQTIGKITKEVSAPVEVDKVMTVAREVNGVLKFIAKVKVIKVSENGAICNIIPIASPAKANVARVAVGDTVYFSDEDAAAAVKASETAPKKPAAGEIPLGEPAADNAAKEE